tara:strand:+ start:2345 stop:3190 length:846 start_codon:yes stop_codon:yes gene_type:complete
MTDSANTPQISTPEQLEGIVAPGQENILEEFVKEQENSQENEKILGKFNTSEDLAKAYTELEKRVGQNSEKETAEPSSYEESSDNYTPEVASEVYGKEYVDALAEKGIDMADIMKKADSGEDISSSYEAMAEVFNVPKGIIENYVNAAQKSQTSSEGLTAEDGNEVRNAIGGDEAFKEVTDWAVKNLDKETLDQYNQIADTNKEATTWALKFFQSQMKSPGSVVEPKLYGGGNVPSENVYESEQQVLDAMNKKNNKGQRLYDVDQAYRDKVAKILLNSKVF